MANSMKVTPLNILRFWKLLMFPPTDSHVYLLHRFKLRTELPWEPWLHAAVWISMLISLAFGEPNLFPPTGGEDWTWLFFGLVSPPVGFFSQWALKYCAGFGRYIAVWTRMVADFGLAIAMSAYLLNHWFSTDDALHIMPSVVGAICVWFMLALVWRDIRFIFVIEKLSKAIHLFGEDEIWRQPNER